LHLRPAGRVSSNSSVERFFRRFGMPFGDEMPDIQRPTDMP
jgi:hypothetical protein